MPRKAQSADTQKNAGLGTNVPSSGSGLAATDPVVRRYRVLNSQIFHRLPAIAAAYVTLAEHLPMLREMQALLSQRPHGGKRIHPVTPIMNGDQLPTWTEWVRDYARAIGYSVRHIRRTIVQEPRKKTTKQCGWSVSDHNKLLLAARLSFKLVDALEGGFDTTALTLEIHEIRDDVADDLLGHDYEPVTVRVRKRPAQRMTRVG